jgi:hypothetical protein
MLRCAPTATSRFKATFEKDTHDFDRLQLETMGDRFTIFLNDVFLPRGESAAIPELGIIGLSVSWIGKTTAWNRGSSGWLPRP